MFKKIFFIFIITLLFNFSVQEAQASVDIGIVSVEYIDDQLKEKNLDSGVPYDPGYTKTVKLKITVKFTGSYCPSSLVVKGIQIGSQVPVYPPISVHRPDSSGFSYVYTNFTIQKGLEFKRYNFTVMVLIGQCEDSNPNNNSLVVPILLVNSRQNTCDYRIESIILHYGDNREGGLPYTPDFPTLCELKVRTRWNKINPPIGIQCKMKIHVLGVYDRRVLLPPIKVPDPDEAGISEQILRFNLPQGLTVGTNYLLRLELLPSAIECDSNRDNSAKNFNIKLLKKSGDDLVIRILKVEKYWDGRERGETIWFPKATVAIANVSGTETLYNVEVMYGMEVEVNGRKESCFIEKNTVIDSLPPRVWVERTLYIRSGWECRVHLGPNDKVTGRAIAKVDFPDRVKEINEGNNMDSKFFRD